MLLTCCSPSMLCIYELASNVQSSLFVACARQGLHDVRYPPRTSRVRLSRRMLIARAKTSLLLRDLHPTRTLYTSVVGFHAAGELASSALRHNFLPKLPRAPFLNCCRNQTASTLGFFSLASAR